MASFSKAESERTKRFLICANNSLCPNQTKVEECPITDTVVLRQQPCAERQQHQGGHCGLQAVRQDKTRSSPHTWRSSRACGQHQVSGCDVPSKGSSSSGS